MKVILLALVSSLLVSCGKVGEGKNPTWQSQRQELRQVELSGVHSGEKWQGKQAIMYDSELFDKPALSFDILSEVKANPCESDTAKSRGVIVTIRNEKKNHEGDYDRYINFYDQNTDRYLASPNFKYELKKKDGVITSLGILFDIDDKDYGIEGFVNVVDCRSTK